MTLKRTVDSFSESIAKVVEFSSSPTPTQTLIFNDILDEGGTELN